MKKESMPDSRAPLVDVDRSTRRGFTRYWAERKAHFLDLYGVEYTAESANAIYTAEHGCGLTRRRRS